MRLQERLRSLVGKDVLARYYVGNLVKKVSGILKEVGDDYLMIEEQDTQSYILTQNIISLEVSKLSVSDLYEETD